MVTLVEPVSIEKIEKIDPMRRPLFAMLLADAVSTGEYPHCLDQEALILSVLDREEARWDDLGISADIRNLIVLATACGGLAIDVSHKHAFESYSAIFPGVNDAVKASGRIELVLAVKIVVYDRDDRPLCFQIPTVEPGVVGELFVLQTLKRLPAVQARLFAQCCWRTDPVNVWAFIHRASGDFPGHKGIERLCYPQLDSKESRLFWGLVLGTLIPKAFADGSVPALRALLPGFYVLMDAAAKYRGEKALQYEAAYSAWYMWRFLWDAADFELAATIAEKYLPEVLDGDLKRVDSYFKTYANKMLSEYRGLADAGFNIEPAHGRVLKAAMAVFENGASGKMRACRLALETWRIMNESNHLAPPRGSSWQTLRHESITDMKLSKMAVHLDDRDTAASLLRRAESRLPTNTRSGLAEEVSPAFIPWFELATNYKSASLYPEALRAFRVAMELALKCPEPAHTMSFQAADAIARWLYKDFVDRGLAVEGLELRDLAREVLKVNFHCRHMSEAEFDEWWSNGLMPKS